MFSARHHGAPGGYTGCARRELPLRQGYCRLCWCQARADRAVLATSAREASVRAPVYLPLVRQLFFAGLDRRVVNTAASWPGV
jgi:hypothetical protein